MKTHASMVHERVDEIPLLIGLAQKLHLPERLDHHLHSHGSHQGLSNGTLAAVWIAFILSRDDHTKIHVQEWTQDLQHTLSRLIGQPLRPAEFSDDRLGILLRRLQELELEDWDALDSAVSVVLQRQPTVPALHARTRSLEQSRALVRYFLHFLSFFLCQRR